MDKRFNSFSRYSNSISGEGVLMTYAELLEVNKRIVTHCYEKEKHDFEMVFNLEFEDLNKAIELCKKDVHKRSHVFYSLMVLKQFYHL